MHLSSNNNAAAATGQQQGRTKKRKKKVNAKLRISSARKDQAGQRTGRQAGREVAGRQGAGTDRACQFGAH